ncbi:endonuclease 8-like 1 isoform X5 [Corvus hawaiiensis]|uniref:endonuclease 8-like 1 isoform X5 n=1 Tax=Corvus hawaiiensis TaxID=134902 RepID=UPI002019102D|nr:endonuclease 8-like 1 isoform X5 [Corvus hawaiiensis]XP_048173802.1 endonuclease 8-like 1 isoform X5 [Corvus hawaiiensis]
MAGGCDSELGAHTGALGWGGGRFPALWVSGGPRGSSNKVPVTKLSRLPLYAGVVRRFPAAGPPRQDNHLRYHGAANGSAHRPPRSQWERAPPAAQPMGARTARRAANGSAHRLPRSQWGRAVAAGGGELGLRWAVAAMPECPELHLAGRFINGACGALVFTGGVERSAVGRGPEVPFRSEAYRISAIARGKELRLTLSALDPAGATPPQDLVFRFGMSGSFRLCPAAELPRHAHLRFLTRESPPRALCFVDPRRFGSWRLGDAWQPERGPCVVSEYQAFRGNVLKNLDDRAFDKPICEVLLNQKYFNGIGNYLRAEILYRLKIPPFEKARTVLEALKDQEQERRKKDPSLTLSKKVKLKQENPDLLELCHMVPMEVIMAEKQLLDPEHSDNYAAFKNWLQCYLVPGMSSLRDRSGRTIWFQGRDPARHPARRALS